MKKNLKLAIMLVAASILGSAATMMATSELQKKGVITDTYVLTKESKTTSDGFVQTSSRPVDLSRDFTDVAESTINCVVSIKSYATPQQSMYQGDFFDPFEFFFGPGFGQGQRQRQQQQPKKSEPQPRGMGSGVIISPDGYIVTNNHVIAGADVIEVTLENNKVYPARLVGTDPATDIALIKVDAEDLPVVPIGNSDDLRLGEWVLAIGSPYDLRSTITAGIVSAKGRSMPNYDGQYRVESFIQTDAAVNPGNSGGALVNAAGELVGINTSIISRTGSYAGYSFAVPVNIVSKVVDDFIEFGAVQRAMLGISITDVNAEVASRAGLNDIDGVYVASVQKDGPADKGGITEGDVIKEINLNAVHNSAGLQEQISKLRPGEKAVVTVVRDGRQHEIIVTL